MQKQLAIKIILIFVIGLIILVPVEMIKSKVYERQGYQAQAERAVASSWTGPQILMTPVLVIPYRLSATLDSGFRTANSATNLERVSVVIPASLDTKGSFHSKSVFKGIYEVQVYEALLELSGSISKSLITERLEELKNEPRFESMGTPFLAVHLSDMRGIAHAPNITINNEEILLKPGSGLSTIGNGMHAPLSSLANIPKAISFSLAIELRGMGEFSMIHLADEATSKLTSDWPHPEFIGAYLPSERSVSTDGFKASWSSTRFSSNAEEHLQQCLQTSTCNELMQTAFGVRFIDPVDVYLQSERATKYAMLFIGLSFVTFFIFEHLRKVRIHPIQFSFVGLAVTVFYLLLLSLAEHIAFPWAYLVSVIGCTGLLLFYVRYMFKSFGASVLFTVMMLVLYGILYVIVQAEDFAQLMGAFLVFFILALLMYTTRKLDWYRMEFVDDLED